MLPAAVRRAAQIDEGAEVIARPDGRGRVVIETVESIRARVWAGAPERGDRDMTADVRALRDEDIRVSAQALARRTSELGSPAESAAAGAALLANLDL